MTVAMGRAKMDNAPIRRGEIGKLVKLMRAMGMYIKTKTNRMGVAKFATENDSKENWSNANARMNSS